MNASLAGLAQERLNNKLELVGVIWENAEVISNGNYINNIPIHRPYGRRCPTRNIGTNTGEVDWQAGIAPMAHQK